jgi:hypothetical protein
MEREHAETSSRRRGVQGALANKQAADSRADALASTFRELMAAGFLSRRSLAGELNRRGIPTAQGGRWHYNTVVRMLTRLGLQDGEATPLYGWPFKCRTCASRDVTLFDIESQAELDQVRPTVQRVKVPSWAVTNYAPRDPDADLP